MQGGGTRRARAESSLPVWKSCPFATTKNPVWGTMVSFQNKAREQDTNGKRSTRQLFLGFSFFCVRGETGELHDSENKGRAIQPTEATQRPEARRDQRD